MGHIAREGEPFLRQPLGLGYGVRCHLVFLLCWGGSLACFLGCSPAAMVFGSEQFSFSREVSPSCQITGLQCGYDLRNLTSCNGDPRLQSYAHTFYVESNVAASLIVSYEILSEPQRFVAQNRWASLNAKDQNGAGNMNNALYSQSENSPTPPFVLDTPGSISATVGMLIMAESMPPGSCRYRATLTCLQ